MTERLVWVGLLPLPPGEGPLKPKQICIFMPGHA